MFFLSIPLSTYNNNPLLIMMRFTVIMQSKCSEILLIFPMRHGYQKLYNRFSHTIVLVSYLSALPKRNEVI